MYLGIEIGGTKLQWIVGNGRDTSWVARRLTSVDRSRQADGIRDQLVEVTSELIASHPQIERIGIGFGGPVDSREGMVIESHQIDGWRGFPLVKWLEERFRRPTVLANDSDCAGLAEAIYGAGRGATNVFYSNVGSGIGGAFVIHGQLYTGGSGIASEIGHLRPFPTEPFPTELSPTESSDHIALPDENARKNAYAYSEAPIPATNGSHNFRRTEHTWASDLTPTSSDSSHSPDFTHSTQNPPDVEAMASGWAITEYVRERCLAAPQSVEARAILDSIGGSLELLDTRAVVRGALEDHNSFAIVAMARCTRVYGWAIAQMVTLLSPEVVVIGGGVSLADPSLFLEPLREHVSQNVFPALRNTYRLVPAALNEEVVAAGAIAIATATN